MNQNKVGNIKMQIGGTKVLYPTAAAVFVAAKLGTPLPPLLCTMTIDGKEHQFTHDYAQTGR